jgi:hypothetical protein
MNGRVMVFEGHQAERPDVDVGAHMYDSATRWAFGPLFDSADDCKEFMEWTDQQKGQETDLRRLTTLELYELHATWMVVTRRAT